MCPLHVAKTKVKGQILTSLSTTKKNFEIKYPLHIIQNAQPYNNN